MTSSSAIYLRVSRDDLTLDKQLTAIQNKFNVVDPFIIEEKISAYDEVQQEKRLDFQRLKTSISEGVITEVYIFSVERLERNIVRLFEFYFFCEAYDCKIYSVQQDIPNRKDNEKPMDTFLRYINVLLFGYKGQEESYTISYRTKSAVENHNNNTFSIKGNKWGKQFKGLDGNNIEVSLEELENIQSFILREIKKYESGGQKGYYKAIIDKVAKSHKISISKAYISVLKNGGSNK